MSDDLYEKYAKGPSDAAARVAFATGLELGIEIGQQQGMAAGLIVGRQQGRIEGYLAAVEDHNAAVSDGTRHGSSECGKKLRARRTKGGAAPK